MSEEIVYDASVDAGSDGTYTALLLDLLGCYARGASEAEALTRLRHGIPAYYEWLSRHDEYTPIVQGPFGVRRIEALHTSAGTGTAFFESDAQPMTDEDLDWALAVLGWAYDDLLSLARSVSLERLTQPGSEGYTPKNLLAYTSQTQIILLTHLAPTHQPANMPAQPPADIVGQLNWAREATLDRLRATSDDERMSVHDDTNGERWSLRKLLRRSVLLVREATERLEMAVRQMG
ncbi:MAG: type II toxin-antitoxin system HicB family antitoxin [Ktedonobacterales bacterium]